MVLKKSTDLSDTKQRGSDEITSCTGYDVFDDLDTGWAWMEMVASFGTFCLIGGTMYAVGIIHSALLEQFNENVSLTSWAGALHSALISAGGPLSSALIDRFSCRTAIVASGVFYVIGYLGTAFAPNLETAIFTCGIVAGLGGAFGYTASMVVVGFSFRRRLNIALGFALSGIGVGLFTMAPAMQFSRDYYGTTGFFIILAAFSLNIITFGVMCFPSKLEKDAKIKRKFEVKIQKEAACRKSSTFGALRSYLHILLNKAVLCLCCSMFNFCLGTFVIYLHLPTYIVLKGFSQVEASFFVSISGILSLIGRLLTGVIASFDILSDIHLYSGSMGIVSIATFLLPHYSKYYWGQIVYAVSLGLFFGSCYVVMTSVNIQFVGVNYMSAAIGIELFLGGIGALVGPVFAGIIVDYGGTYDHSFYIAASCILLATISSATTMCLSSPEKSGGLDVIEIDIKSQQPKLTKTEEHFEETNAVV